MTLIGAICLPDRLIIGSDGRLIGDSQVLLPSGKTFTPKWAKGLRWTYAGAQPIGVAFGTWIGETPFDGWAQLTEAAVIKLARLNHDARASATDAGTETEAADVLVVGFLGGVGKILYLDDEEAPQTGPRT